MTFRHSTSQSAQRGATILEFALVSAIFFFALLALFDFTRYFSLQALLTKGAQNGLEVAKVIDGLRIDPEDLDENCAPNNQACIQANYQRMMAARRTVEQSATALPLATFASEPNSGGSFPLDSYTINSDNPPAAGQTPPAAPSINAVILRPGEVTTNNRTGQIVEHPQICPLGATSCGNNKRPRAPTETLTGLYRAFPIVVQVQTEFKPLFPFWTPFQTTGTAIGYREISTGSIDPQIPASLACQNPPPCGANSFLTPACTCQCNLQCRPIGSIPTVPNSDCTECVCDSSYQCPDGQHLNTSSCSCGCTVEPGAPNSQQACEDANGGVADSYWEFQNCSCVCPASLEQDCYDRDMRFNRNTCSCVDCRPGDDDCAGECPVLQLSKQCGEEDPPRDFDPEECDCAEVCSDPVQCTHGTIIGCDYCRCTDCGWRKERQNIGEEQCGPCVCASYTQVAQGCNDPNFPIANYSNCQCEAPGGGPSS